MAVIITDKAPKPIGPYSQAIVVEPGSVVYVSGQTPLDPVTMTIASDDIAAQSRQTLENVKAILAAADCTLSDVVKTTCFLSDMNNFAAFNAVYAEYFTGEAPARSCVEVARLPMDVLVEVEAVAIKT
ncbi:MAG: RidA family protein [Planctomycetaceae bacterium]|nr:RidA family protein [Planctomycetaceae bacterium]